MRGASDELGVSIEKIAKAANGIRDNAHGAMASADGTVSNLEKSSEMVNRSNERFSEIDSEIDSHKGKIEQITGIIDIVKKIAGKSSLLALNASIEAARAGEAGRGFMVVANQMQELAKMTAKSSDDVAQYVAGLTESLDSIFTAISDTTEDLSEGNSAMLRCVDGVQQINDMLTGISGSIDAISDEINTQYALTENFISSVDVISDSYKSLNDQCIETGSHLYKISRKVDKVRTNMAKTLARLGEPDWIEIFEVDHLIFTWRQYNHLVGYEKLELHQVNNPDGCKLGKWILKQKDPKITGLPAFKNINAIHRELHKYATESFEFTKEGNREEALKAFDKAYAEYIKLIPQLEEIRKAVC